MAKSGPVTPGISAKQILVGLIAVLVLASGVCCYLAYNQFSEAYLTASEASQPPAPAYQVIAFDPQGNLIGASMKSGKLMIDRFGQSGAPSHFEVVLRGEAPGQWIVSQDANLFAWLAGPDRVLIQRTGVDGQKPWAEPKSLPVRPGLINFGLMSNGVIASVTAKGDLASVEVQTGKTLSRVSLGEPVSWAEIRGEYAAISSSSKIRIYRLVEQMWKLTEETTELAGRRDLRLPADGQVVAVVKAGVLTRSGTLNSPGRVSEVVMSDQGFVIVSGDFRGIYVLPQTMQPYRLTDAPKEAQIAASRRAIAYTSAAGTVLLSTQENTRLTETGRMIMGLAIALVVLAVLAGLLLLYFEAGSTESIQRRVKDSKEKQTNLPKPPPDLIHAISSGEATLWAGAGLSAPSGMPLRTAFLSTVFQTALNEGWLTSAQLDKYWKLVANGKAEEAFNQFIASDPAMRIRSADMVRASYNRFATLNESQRELAKLPFNTAITTNYDCLLERTGAPWALNISTIRGRADILALGSHLVVKLFGDFESGTPPILSREEFGTALADNPEFVAEFARLFDARPILFVGASIEGLLIDLAALGAPRAAVKHYCVAGVSSYNWKSSAARLKSKYNIEVLACDVLNIQTETKIFLGELAEAVATTELAGTVPLLGISS